MKKTIRFIVVLLCLISMGLSLVACSNSKLTMENFNKIECATMSMTTYQYTGGMSLDEVKGILGEPDSSTSSSVMGYTAIAYTWGDETKNIIISFYNNKAITKVQTGL